MAVSQYYPASVPAYMGLSTDTKPAAAIGAKFTETDTGKVWMMTNTGSWLQVAAIPTSAWTEPAIAI